MDLPAFALHEEPLRRKFYRPKLVFVRSFTQSGFGALYSFASFALVCTIFCARIAFAASGL